MRFDEFPEVHMMHSKLHNLLLDWKQQIELVVVVYRRIFAAVVDDPDTN